MFTLGVKSRCLAIPLLAAFVSACAQADRLPGAQLAGDVKILRSALEQIHPRLYRYTAKPELDRAFDSLALDVRGGMTEAEFLTRVAEIAVKVRCGHTFVNLMNQKDADLDRMFNKRTFLPLYFRLIGTRMLVTENISNSVRLKSGTEILEINDVPIRRVLGTLLQASTADGLHNTPHRYRSLEVQREPGEARNYTNLFDVYYPQFFPLRSKTYRLKARDLKTGKTFLLSTPALTKAERIAKAERAFGALPAPESAWQFSLLNNTTGYMHLASFFTYGWKLDTAAFYRNAFAQMKDAGVKSLIVDLRGNVGGLVQNATELEAYLKAPTVGSVSQQRTLIKCLQVSRGIAPYLNTYEGSIGKLLTTGLPTDKLSKTPEGLFEVVDSAADKQSGQPVDRFTGKVFFLADATNASAASELLARVRANHAGTIVGEQTAGNMQGINTGVLFLRLPASKVEIDIPALALVPITSESDGGVLPDIEVHQKAEDVAAGRDTQLQAALEMAKHT